LWSESLVVARGTGHWWERTRFRVRMQKQHGCARESNKPALQRMYNGGRKKRGNAERNVRKKRGHTKRDGRRTHIDVFGFGDSWVASRAPRSTARRLGFGY
jgi:hypothetical protein